VRSLSDGRPSGSRQQTGRINSVHSNLKFHRTRVEFTPEKRHSLPLSASSAKSAVHFHFPLPSSSHFKSVVQSSPQPPPAPQNGDFKSPSISVEHQRFNPAKSPNGDKIETPHFPRNPLKLLARPASSGPSVLLLSQGCTPLFLWLWNGFTPCFPTSTISTPKP
jgi:hypothetical protein